MGIQDLLGQIAAADGVEALSEHKWMRISGAFDIREQVLLTDTGKVVGYAQAAWHGAADDTGHWAIEVVASEEHRDPDTVAELIEAMRIDVAADDSILWSRAAYTDKAAGRDDWVKTRALIEMRCDLPAAGVAGRPSGLVVKTFRIGVDEEVWLRLNNAAFAGHPENGNMTRADLERRIARPWFDPAGFFLGWIDGELVASCWTKVHDDGVGEIYIIGVDPRWEGRGLGKSMLRVGLHHLAETGQARVAMLYVEADNQRAIGLYRRLGFARVRSINAYGHSPQPDVTRSKEP